MVCVCVQESVEDMGLYEDVSAAGTSVQVTVTHSGYSIIILIFDTYSIPCCALLLFSMLCYSILQPANWHQNPNYLLRLK